MKHRSGWYIKRKAREESRVHFFDNDAEWSICGGLRYQQQQDSMELVGPGGAMDWGFYWACRRCDKMLTGVAMNWLKRRRRAAVLWVVSAPPKEASDADR